MPLYKAQQYFLSLPGSTSIDQDNTYDHADVIMCTYIHKKNHLSFIEFIVWALQSGLL